MNKLKRNWKNFKHENPKTAKGLKYGAIATGSIIAITAMGVALGSGIGATLAVTSAAGVASKALIGVYAGTAISLASGLTIGGALGGGVGAISGVAVTITKIKSEIYCDKVKEKIRHLAPKRELIDPQVESSRLDTSQFILRDDSYEDLLAAANAEIRSFTDEGQNAASSSQSISSISNSTIHSDRGSISVDALIEKDLYELSLS